MKHKYTLAELKERYTDLLEKSANYARGGFIFTSICALEQAKIYMLEYEQRKPKEDG